jgi:hypothetical protein
VGPGPRGAWPDDHRHRAKDGHDMDHTRPGLFDHRIVGQGNPVRPQLQDQRSEVRLQPTSP